MKGLFIPGVTELGASSDSFPSGIVIPGANVMTLPPGEWVDLSDIDLTSSALDYRVSFSCASNHAYYSADGTIQFAAPDVWPLEYRNGVAVGRHEPEPQATNFSTSGALPPAYSSGKMIVNGSELHGALNIFDFTLDTSVRGDRYVIYLTSALIANGYITASFYTAMGGSGNPSRYSANRVIVYGNTGNYLDRRSILDFLTDTITPYQGQGAYIESVRLVHGGGLVRNVITLQTQSPVTRTDIRAMVTPDGLQTDVNLSGLIGGIQIEQGKLITSPILTTGEAKTRAAAFATVQNPGGLASAIMVHYSDNTSEQLEIPTNSPSIQLPQSANDWGKRYIQRIEYIR